ncbi:uncharacterized protein LOC107015887 isoform X2 [Solanum pennellii]|uniref:Uncharacterized protein LOC107015887 isoform X2 n=1 Tax=Solanum pennellii TaxID=28526 RepID=A0ABM1VA31_SOLPN|nr:uncharacterized protein LOC107015887 isoform X2 [Solanum pennellii]
MEFFRKLSILVIFCLITISSEIIHTNGNQQNVEEDKKEQSPTQILEEAYSMLLTSTLRSLDVAKSYINQLQLKYFPPNVESNDDVSANGGAGGRIMEATQKSFEKSKETVKGSAKSAAEAVEQKVHDTADKVKDTISAGRKTDEKTEDTVPSGHDEL